MSSEINIRLITIMARDSKPNNDSTYAVAMTGLLDGEFVNAKVIMTEEFINDGNFLQKVSMLLERKASKKEVSNE